MQLEFLTLSEMGKLRNAVSQKKRKYEGNILYKDTYKLYSALYDKLLSATKIVLEIGEPEISTPKKRKG